MSAAPQHASRVAPSRPWWYPGLLEWRLFLVALVGLLPLALLSATLLMQDIEGRRSRLLEAAQNTTLAVNAAVDTELSLVAAALDVLAASPRLQLRDLDSFQREMSELLERRQDWGNIILSSPDGTHLANARQQRGAALHARIDPEAIQRVVRERKPLVGNVVLAPNPRQYMFHVFVPVMAGSRVAYVLAAALKPEFMLPILLRHQLRQGQLMSIVDGNNRFVARSLNHEGYVGKLPSRGFLAMLGRFAGQGLGADRSVTLEGQPVYTAFTRSKQTGWVSAYAIPAALVDGPLRKTWTMLGLATLFSVILGLLVAYLVARTITRPMHKLEQAAQDLGQGREPRLPRTGLREIHQIGDALLAAYEDREHRLKGERDARLFAQRAREEAERASHAKDQFLAMLGHELRNPLAAISAAAQILEVTGEDNHHHIAREARVIIERQARHLGKLTDDLLNAGRIVLGKIQLDPRPADLAELVAQQLMALDKTGRLGDARLTLEVEEAWAEVDATRLEQVIDNLVANAVKYSPAPANIHVRVGPEDDQAVLSVSDSGIGMEADLQKRVFDLFVQGERSLDRSQGGLGIGLTLVRQLVELHGGSVSAKSEGPGKGSCFTVRLPRIAAQAAEPRELRPGHDGRGLAVVVVEDNEDLGLSLAHLLHLQGHRVQLATDGQAGLDLILHSKPDCALVDIGLPVLDGFGIARALRSQGEQAVLLLAMSGYGDEQTRDEALAAGFNEFLPKPVDAARLAGLLAGADRAAA